VCRSTLVHSKRTQDHGFLHQNQAQIDKVVRAIEEAGLTKDAAASSTAAAPSPNYLAYAAVAAGLYFGAKKLGVL
jgi:hypothetical protein